MDSVTQGVTISLSYSQSSPSPSTLFSHHLRGIFSSTMEVRSILDVVQCSGTWTQHSIV
jgi:hypothetical protein